VEPATLLNQASRFFEHGRNLLGLAARWIVARYQPVMDSIPHMLPRRSQSDIFNNYQAVRLYGFHQTFDSGCMLVPIDVMQDVNRQRRRIDRITADGSSVGRRKTYTRKLNCTLRDIYSSGLIIRAHETEFRKAICEKVLDCADPCPNRQDFPFDLGKHLTQSLNRYQD
jgi:hypothetical protein